MRKTNKKRKIRCGYCKNPLKEKEKQTYIFGKRACKNCFTIKKLRLGEARYLSRKNGDYSGYERLMNGEEMETLIPDRTWKKKKHTNPYKAGGHRRSVR